MNKSLYSNCLFDRMMYPARVVEDFTWEPGEKITQKKEKKMDNFKDKPFSVRGTWGSEEFATLEEATKYARRQVMDSKEDTVIRQNIAVVKFPVPDYEVETLATVA